MNHADLLTLVSLCFPLLLVSRIHFQALFRVRAHRVLSFKSSRVWKTLKNRLLKIWRTVCRYKDSEADRDYSIITRWWLRKKIPKRGLQRGEVKMHVRLTVSVALPHSERRECSQHQTREWTGWPNSNGHFVLRESQSTPLRTPPVQDLAPTHTNYMALASY